MSKKTKKKARNEVSIVEPTPQTDAKPLEKGVYNRELKRLHVELVKLQEWVRAENKKVCIIFEGRDGAGKGGVI